MLKFGRLPVEVYTLGSTVRANLQTSGYEPSSYLHAVAFTTKSKHLFFTLRMDSP